MKALEMIKNSSLDPPTIERLSTAFDRIWTNVGDNFTTPLKPQARTQLARLLLDLHAEGTSADQLEAEAFRLINTPNQ